MLCICWLVGVFFVFIKKWRGHLCKHKTCNHDILYARYYLLSNLFFSEQWFERYTWTRATFNIVDHLLRKKQELKFEKMEECFIVSPKDKLGNINSWQKLKRRQIEIKVWIWGTSILRQKLRWVQIKGKRRTCFLSK